MDDELELEILDEQQGLFLKQFWKVLIIVKLPQITVPGQSISNWDLMERLKKAVSPIKMEGIKVRESTLETVSFEAELLNKSYLGKVVRALEGLGVKVSGWAEPLRVHAKEAVTDFPTRVDWDKHFGRLREKGKPGLRPDTLHLSKVPANWFNDGIVDGPCERLFRKAFEYFGPVRLADIPICDPLRPMMPSDISGLPKKAASFGPEVLFDGFIQFVNYDSFAKVMEKLKNRKWVKRTTDGRTFFATVKVDFDRQGHLSDGKVVAREAERDRLTAERRRKVEEENEKRLEEERKRQEAEEEQRQRRELREMRRKIKRELERRRAEEERILEKRRREEETRLRKEQETLASNLLKVLMERIQEREDRRIQEEEEKLKEELAGRDLNEVIPVPEGREETSLRETLLKQQENRIRERLMQKVLTARRKTEESSSSEEEESKKSKKKRKKEDKKRKTKRKKEKREEEKRSHHHHHHKSKKRRSRSTSSSD